MSRVTVVEKLRRRIEELRGKPADERIVVRPDVLMASLLDEVAGRLLELDDRLVSVEGAIKSGLRTIGEDVRSTRKATEKLVPEGYLVPLTVDVVERETITFPEGEEWSCFDYYNDGPDPVYIGVNTYPREEVARNPRESGSIPFMGKGKIKTIYFICGADKSTTIRLWGLR